MEANPKQFPMDFQRVAKRFRHVALLVQLTFIGLVLLYLAYRLVQVIASTDAPPVSISLERWTSAGTCAVCTHPDDPDGLRRAGIRLPNRQNPDPNQPSHWTSWNQSLNTRLVSGGVSAAMQGLHVPGFASCGVWGCMSIGPKLASKRM